MFYYHFAPEFGHIIEIEVLMPSKCLLSHLQHSKGKEGALDDRRSFVLPFVGMCWEEDRISHSLISKAPFVFWAVLVGLVLESGSQAKKIWL